MKKRRRQPFGALHALEVNPFTMKRLHDLGCRSVFDVKRTANLASKLPYDVLKEVLRAIGWGPTKDPT